MIKSNSIFEAMGNIDDEIAANAVKSAERSKRKPLKLVIFGAVAAAVLSLVGFTTAEFVKNTIIIEGAGQVKLDLYKQDITIVPREELPSEKYTLSIDMPTDELFGKFGVSPLMNNNFSYDVTPSKQWYTSDGNNSTPIPIDISLPRVWYEEECVVFVYCLYDKNLDKNIRMHALYPIVDDVDISYIIEKNGDYIFGEHEVIKLNDGSDCHLSNYHGARFAHDGVLYFFYSDENYSDFDMETQKQIISDFGLL